MAESAKKVKIRRKDLRGPDEFETLTGEGIAWAQKHQTKFIVGVVGVLVVGAVALLIARSRAVRNQDASIEFHQARVQLENGSAAAAATQFASLEQSASSTAFGQLAGLYRGHALLKQGDGAGAASAYTQYLSTASAPDYLRQQALVGLGNAKQLGGDNSGAHDAYLQAEKLDGPAKDEAALGVARTLEAQGQADQARAIYARLAKDAPEGWVRTAAQEKAPGVATDETAAAAEPVIDVQ